MESIRLTASVRSNVWFRKYKTKGTAMIEVVLSSEQLKSLASMIVEMLPQRSNATRRLGCEEAAKVLGVSLSSLRRAIQQGMPVLRPTPRKIVIDIDVAAKWMMESNKKADTED